MSKSRKYLKILTVLSTGKVVTKEELAATLGKVVPMGRLSSYMWDAKHYGGAKIETQKDGKKVVAYKLLNPDKFKNAAGSAAVVPSAPAVAVVAASAAKAKKPAKVAKVKAAKAGKKPAKVTVKPKKVSVVKKNAPVNATGRSEPSGKPVVVVKDSPTKGEVASFAVDPDFDNADLDVPDFLKRV